MNRVQVGEFEVHLLSDGTFRLDGGAMFGVVPKPLWETIHVPDERNRIRLGIDALLVVGRGRRILIESGIGGKSDAKFASIYGIERPVGLVGELAHLGVAPEAIDVVVLTHLHFDHAGGLTRREGGEVVPVFPRAVHVVQRAELAYAHAPPDRVRPSYLPDDFAPVEAAGLFRLADGAGEVEPGIRVVPTPGHAPHHQSVLVESGGRTLAYWGDLVPTAGHTHVPYVMGYDLEPAVTVEQKKEWLARAERDRWLVTWTHEPDPWVGRVVRERGRFRSIPCDA